MLYQTKQFQELFEMKCPLESSFGAKHLQSLGIRTTNRNPLHNYVNWLAVAILISVLHTSTAQQMEANVTALPLLAFV